MDLPNRRPAFEPGELNALLDHIAYEWLMFQCTRTRWNASPQRYVLEALLLHCRNLRGFLFGKFEEQIRFLDKALFATDYAPEWNSDKGNHLYKVLWETERAIDAQLAHLSRKRVEPAAQEALDEKAEAIASAVAAAWDSFCQSLSLTWSDALDKAIAAKRAELAV